MRINEMELAYLLIAAVGIGNLANSCSDSNRNDRIEVLEQRVDSLQGIVNELNQYE